MYLKLLTIISLLQVSSANIQKQLRNAHGWKLPNSTYPLHYRLHLTTQIHRQIYTYTGNNTIELFVRDETNELILQAENLTITDIKIKDFDTGLQLACVGSELEVEHQLLIIKRDTDCYDRQTTDKGNLLSRTAFKRYQRLSLIIQFKGEIGNSKFGFNKIRHTNSDDDNGGADKESDGNTVFGAGTFFEPDFARSVFPCYDEPGFKVNVTLSISHGEGFNAFSNMPIQSQRKGEEGSDMITTEFWTTPPIAIYLLAFVITQPYHIISKESSDGILHRILLPARTKPESSIALEGLKALENSIEAVRTISEYFNQSYVLPKLDHCAFPEQFGAAMENWGLITYKPKYLLEASPTEQGIPLIVQNHEILHQWFGNLVTPINWSHIWLSEGMATYFSYTLTDMSHPSYKVKYLFDKTCYSSYSKSPKEAIISTFERREDLMQFFGKMMYDRAPCVLRMFSHAIGQEEFQKALTKYIAENKYGNVASASLTSALQTILETDLMTKNKTWNYNIATIMNSWLEQPNYPIVTVRRNATDNNLYITQQSFDAKSKQLWWLPLTFETPSFRLTEKTDKALLYMPPLPEYNLNLRNLLNFNDTDWYLLNPYGKSFYPVNYDTDNWERLIKALLKQPLDFSCLTRISLMRNLWLACSRKLLENPLILLQFLAYLRLEPDFWVIQQNADLIIDVHLLIFERSEYDELYKKFMLSTLATHNISTVVIDDNSSPDLIELNFYYMDLDTRIQLSSDEFKQKLDACKQTNITEEVLDCYRSLALLCDTRQYELLLDEVYQIKSTEEPVQCEGKLQYMAHTLVSAHAVDHNVTWIKLEKNFPEILEQSVCEVRIWAEALLEEAYKIELRYLAEILKSIDLYDEKVKSISKEQSLKNTIMRRRTENLLTPVAGLRHWFFEHVNHTEMSQFLIKEINKNVYS